MPAEKSAKSMSARGQLSFGAADRCDDLAAISASSTLAAFALQADATVKHAMRVIGVRPLAAKVNDAGDFGAIDAAGFAIELEFDLVVRNVAEHALDVVQTFAVALDDNEHVAARFLLRGFRPIASQRLSSKGLKRTAATCAIGKS